jgi:hypothetical protein
MPWRIEHDFNMNFLDRLWHTMQRPEHKKRRGRTTVSTQVSGGVARNSAPLHTRQRADNMDMVR